MDVDHCLLALPGVQESDITRIMSHPLALAQCDAWLQQRPHLTRQAVSDTALAAKTIATQGLRCCPWRCLQALQHRLRGLCSRKHSRQWLLALGSPASAAIR